jgi:SAM-dependent methyltransferase
MGGLHQYMNKFYKKYFLYLQERSYLGYLYRNYWLYPKLCSHLSERVLDVGCGIGDLLRYRKNTIGCDINPETVKYCQLQGFDAHLMEVGELPFETNSFDGVVLDNVLEHIEDPHLILCEIERVLVSGGCLIVGVPGIKGFANDYDHKVFYSKGGLIDLLIRYRFVESAIFSMPLNWRCLDAAISQYCVYGVFRKQ